MAGLRERGRSGQRRASPPVPRLPLASAAQAGCRYFLSEDLNDGQLYGDVRVLDPFRHEPEAIASR